jgi:muramidase (phage lysozyme)
MIKFQGIGAQGNYSQAGKAVADDTLRSFLAARRNSPNYGEMAITAADIRKKEKLATLKNQAEVAATRLTADADVKAKKMQIDSASKLKTAKRKAGALAVAGQMATEAGTLFGQEKRQLRELGGDDTYYNNQTALINKRRGEIETRMKEGYGTKSEPLTESPTSTTTTSSKLTNTSGSGSGWNALGATLKFAEGTYKQGDKSYNTGFGYNMIDDLSKHPDTVFNNTSAAAGAYQFMPKTWKRVSSHLGLTDFSPTSQEAAGEQLAKWRDVDTTKTYTTRAGFVQDMYKMAPEWASIPTANGKSYYDGDGINSAKPMEDLINFYESQVGYKLK